MKKTIIFITSILLVMFVLISCNGKGDIITDEKKENVRYDIFFRLYGSQSVKSLDNDISEEEKEKLQQKYATIEFGRGGRTHVQRRDDAADTVDMSIDGRSYRMEYKGTYRDKLAKNDRFGDSMDYVEYNFDNGRAQIRTSTKELIFFSDRSKANIGGDMTNEKAVEIAEATFIDTYGQEVRQKYELDGVYRSDNTPYNVSYTRKIHGMRTEDRIAIGVNGKGEIIIINAQSMGFYDGAEKDLTKQEVENAKNHMLERLGQRYDARIFTLVMSREGKYFIEAYVTAPNSDISTAELAYINIQ